MTYAIKIPSCVYAGAGSIAHLADIFAKEHTTKVLLFTDQGVMNNGLCDHAVQIMEDCHVAYELFTDLKPEPSWLAVEELVKSAEQSECDLIIAIGGGSVMDPAKLVALLKGSDYTVQDLLKDPKIAVKQIKTVFCPTTSGTGAEATYNAIVAIPEKETKQGIVNDSMVSDYVILDTDMITHLPAKILGNTGVDALAHCVECYTGNRATPLSDTYALAGAKLIFDNLEKAYADPDNLEARSNLMLGAFYGGIAIAGAGTTAAHALAYPLGGRFHMAHGVSVAVVFAQCMKFNEDAIVDRLSTLCDYVWPEYSSHSDQEKADYVIERIEQVVHNTGIPLDLMEWGVTIDDMDFLVQAGYEQQRLLKQNIKVLTPDDIRAIYATVVK